MRKSLLKSQIKSSKASIYLSWESIKWSRESSTIKKLELVEAESDIFQKQSPPPDVKTGISPLVLLEQGGATSTRHRFTQWIGKNVLQKALESALIQKVMNLIKDHLPIIKS